jgi:hypothetical protein
VNRLRVLFFKDRDALRVSPPLHLRRLRCCPPAPRPEPLLHLELRRLYEVRLHEHYSMLYNGGHADSKGRIGEKHGVRGAERGRSPTPPGWRLSGEEWADLPTDCDVCIKQLLATDAVHKIGAPWHRLALVDLMSVKLCPIFLSIDM